MWDVRRVQEIQEVSKMKIGVDAGCLGITDERLKVGVYQVVKNLLIQLGKMDHENDYLLYSFAPIDKQLMKEFGVNMKNVVVIPSRGWTKIWLPLRLLLDEPKVFLALNQAAPFKFLTSSYKTLGIFYDIAFEKYPALYSYAASVKRHKTHSKYLAETGDSFIAISQKTKEDVMKIYGISSDKITVAYPGVGDVLDVLPYENKLPYFLFVGAFKKSKNIPAILKALRKFLDLSKKQYDLLLVGGDKWLDPEITQVFQKLPKNVQNHIKILGFVDEKTLVSLYKGTVALVSPSLYEGFGLPFVEAMKYGCPVIASNRGSLPEVIGDAGILVAPFNIEELSLALQQMTNGKQREDLIAKSKKQAAKYTWENFAKIVLEKIKSI